MKRGALWGPAHVMAAELAQWGMDANLVKTAASYMNQYPQASLDDWLERLVRLGDLFSSSDQTARYRQQLQEVCRRIENRYPLLQAGQDWAWVLGWAARLLPHYQADIDRAQNVSRVDRFKVQRVNTFHRQPVLGSEGELDIPEVRDEVSDTAKDFFKLMQERSQRKGED